MGEYRTVLWTECTVNETYQESIQILNEKENNKERNDEQMRKKRSEQIYC